MIATVPLAPSANLRPIRENGHLKWERACSRCGHFRIVRNPRAARNLCIDCVAVLSPAERERWAA